MLVLITLGILWAGSFWALLFLEGLGEALHSFQLLWISENPLGVLKGIVDTAVVAFTSLSWNLSLSLCLSVILNDSDK